MTVIVPGNEIGDFAELEEIPEGRFAMPEKMVDLFRRLEKILSEFCPDAKRKVKTKGIAYSDPRIEEFIYLRPTEDSIRIVMLGTKKDFVDPHGRIEELKVPEFGNLNVQFTFSDEEELQMASDYIVLGLCLIDYFAPPTQEDRDETYILEISEGRYEGDVLGGTAHGMGRFTWKNGAVYEGSFVKGEISGMGTYTHSNGDVFKGQFVRGILAEEVKVRKEEPTENSKGRVYWPDGYIY
ncbi:MAG: hypothetical protein MJZ38_01925 [archaeon]|nr:hypothetical protein [archaeon]